MNHYLSKKLEVDSKCKKENKARKLLGFRGFISCCKCHNTNVTLHKILEDDKKQYICSNCMEV